MLRHTQGKDHECDTCGKKFRKMENLNIHKKIHTQTYEGFCNSCDKGFVQISNFRIHMQKYHNTEVPLKTIWGKEKQKLRKLDSH